MLNQDITKLAQTRSFVEGTQADEFSLQTQSDRYDFIHRALIRFD